MADPRRLTLLGLAVAASVAIVPVLLVVLLAVAAARQDDGTRRIVGSERHVSVRHVAALQTFEVGVVRRDRVQAPPPDARTLLARLPACADQWDGRPGPLARVRAWLAPAAPTLSTAERMALQLDAIDQALLRFSAVDNPRVSERVGLDGERWLDAVNAALRTPVTAEQYPQHRFALRCADIVAAVATLAHGDGRILPSLAWRGTEVDRVLARWRADQYVAISPREVARRNPWAGIPGCIYLGHADDGRATHYLAGVRGQDERLCARDDMVGRAGGDHRAPTRLPGEPVADMAPDDPRWQVPPSLALMLQPLATLYRPAGAWYRAHTAPMDRDPDSVARYAYGPNRIALAGSEVDVGFSIDLTIDPELQALAQRTAACYTGRDDVCRLLDMRRKEDAQRALGAAMLEQAMVRMAAIAIVDVDSGRIEALAGALSPCTRQEYDGPGRAARCDRRLPYPVRYQPDALHNPAVFFDAMPASTIKPIMAAAFLSDPKVGARWLATEQADMTRAPAAVPAARSLRAELMRSDSARFLDRMFCADQNFGPCARPWAVQAAARTLGWNGACDAAREDCGKRDLLFGRGVEALGDDDVDGPALEVPFGRLLVEPAQGRLGGPFALRRPLRLDDTRVRRCAAGPDGQRFTKDDWEKCGGGVVVDVVAEGWGQGHARASALGSAGMLARLAAAANGREQVRAPHLVAHVRGAGAAEKATLASPLLPWTIERTEPIGVDRDAASVILSGLSFGPRAGTSRRACEQVLEARDCASLDWIAGKTGTPTFPNDERTLDELARLCAPGVAQTRQEKLACGPLRPYKWFVAAYRTDRNDPRWTKVIAVLTERNWIAATGRIHGAGDHGPNPAAEIAMQIAGRHARVLPWSVD